MKTEHIVLGGLALGGLALALSPKARKKTKKAVGLSDGKKGNLFEFEMKWAGLSKSDGFIGRYKTTERVYDKLEDNYSPHVSFDLYTDEAKGKSKSYKELQTIIKNSKGSPFK